MAREKKRRSSGRRSPLAAAALIGAGLMITGAVYAGASAAFASTDTQAAAASTLTVEDGEKLFTANCATCHGLDLQAALIGAGLMITGAVYAGTSAAFAATDTQAAASTTLTVEDGEKLFQANCAMCHNVAAAGGALTEGKYAPALTETSALHMYAAMVTGPQNMPVFGNMNLSDEDKRDIISALLFQQQSVQIGGASLGSLGPVSEGLFVWIFGIGALVAITVWITAKSN
ncbi:MAG: c-type cytochrome [Microbacterium sp.]|uniref:cytochrome c n=1 Tax=Microbacterium sp. TaxID=51671 RepID=UPI001D242F3A|nr:c-type cytochrome [Microbacterium sp.]MBW8763116.1 c-type cytochrome [Microbacterium sp.]